MPVNPLFSTANIPVIYGDGRAEVGIYSPGRLVCFLPGRARGNGDSFLKLLQSPGNLPKFKEKAGDVQCGLAQMFSGEDPGLPDDFRKFFLRQRF